MSDRIDNRLINTEKSCTQSQEKTKNDESSGSCRTILQMTHPVKYKVYGLFFNSSAIIMKSYINHVKINNTYANHLI